MPLFIYAYIFCAFLASGAAWASAAADEGGPAGPRPSTYQDFVNAVGFDVRTIAQSAQNNGQAIQLDEKVYKPFMDAAYGLKRRLKAEDKTVHPLSLFLRVAMQTGDFGLIELGNRLAGDQNQQRRLFGYAMHRPSAVEFALYKATRRLGTLPKHKDNNVPQDTFKNLAPAYLGYILKPIQKEREKITTDYIQENGYLQRTLFPDSLVDIEKKTFRFTGLPQALCKML